MVSALLALVPPALAVEAEGSTVRSGPVRSRVADDDADLVIFYASEHRGKLGPCGCAVNPRGGLPRLAGYLAAVDRHGPGTPSLLVHAGRWASDRIGDTLDLRPDAQVRNEAFVRAAEAIGFDALNLTFRDAPWLRHADAPDAAVSANVGLDVPAVRYVEAGPWRVAVTGVGRPGSPYLQPEGVAWSDPVAAVRDGVAAWREAADLVVVLAFDTGSDTARIASIPGVDVVIEAGGYPGRQAPWTDEDTVWVQSRDEGLLVGELRLWIDDDGTVARAVDRWVDLDASIPEDRSIRRIARQADRDVAAALERAGLAE